MGTFSTKDDEQNQKLEEMTQNLSKIGEVLGQLQQNLNDRYKPRKKSKSSRNNEEETLTVNYKIKIDGDTTEAVEEVDKLTGSVETLNETLDSTPKKMGKFKEFAAQRVGVKNRKKSNGDDPDDEFYNLLGSIQNPNVRHYIQKWNSGSVIAGESRAAQHGMKSYFAETSKLEAVIQKSFADVQKDINEPGAAFDKNSQELFRQVAAYQAMGNSLDDLEAKMPGISEAFHSMASRFNEYKSAFFANQAAWNRAFEELGQVLESGYIGMIQGVGKNVIKKGELPFDSLAAGTTHFLEEQDKALSKGYTSIMDHVSRIIANAMMTAEKEIKGLKGLPLDQVFGKDSDEFKKYSAELEAELREEYNKILEEASKPEGQIKQNMSGSKFFELFFQLDELKDYLSDGLKEAYEEVRAELTKERSGESNPFRKVLSDEAFGRYFKEYARTTKSTQYQTLGKTTYTYALNPKAGAAFQGKENRIPKQFKARYEKNKEMEVLNEQAVQVMDLIDEEDLPDELKTTFVKWIEQAHKNQKKAWDLLKVMRDEIEHYGYDYDTTEKIWGTRSSLDRGMITKKDQELDQERQNAAAERARLEKFGYRNNPNRTSGGGSNGGGGNYDDDDDDDDSGGSRGGSGGGGSGGGSGSGGSGSGNGNEGGGTYSVDPEDINKITTACTELIDKIEELKGLLNFEDLKKTIAELKTSLETFPDIFTQDKLDLINSAVEKITKLEQELKTGLTIPDDKDIGAYIASLKGDVQSIASGIASIRESATGLAGIFGTDKTALLGLTPGAIDAINTSFSELEGTLGRIHTILSDKLKLNQDDIRDFVKNVSSIASANTSTDTATIEQTQRTMEKSAKREAPSPTTIPSPQVSAPVADLARRSSEAFAAVDFSGMAETFRNQMQYVGAQSGVGFSNGIDSMLDQVREASKNLADAGLEQAKEELGIESPSRKFYDIGVYCIVGFINALKAGSIDIRDAMSGVVQVEEVLAQVIKGMSVDDAHNKFIDYVRKTFSIEDPSIITEDFNTILKKVLMGKRSNDPQIAVTEAFKEVYSKLGRDVPNTSLLGVASNIGQFTIDPAEGEKKIVAGVDEVIARAEEAKKRLKDLHEQYKAIFTYQDFSIKDPVDSLRKDTRFWAIDTTKDKRGQTDEGKKQLDDFRDYVQLLVKRANEGVVEAKQELYSLFEQFRDSPLIDSPILTKGLRSQVEPIVDAYRDELNAVLTKTDISNMDSLHNGMVYRLLESIFPTSRIKEILRQHLEGMNVPGLMQDVYSAVYKEINDFSKPASRARVMNNLVSKPEEFPFYRDYSDVGGPDLIDEVIGELDEKKQGIVRKFLEDMKTLLGENYSEAQALAQALSTLNAIDSNQFSEIYDYLGSNTPATNSLVNAVYGTNYDFTKTNSKKAALRAIDPKAYNLKYPDDKRPANENPEKPEKGSKQEEKPDVGGTKEEKEKAKAAEETAEATHEGTEEEKKQGKEIEETTKKAKAKEDIYARILQFAKEISSEEGLARGSTANITNQLWEVYQEILKAANEQREANIPDLEKMFTDVFANDSRIKKKVEVPTSTIMKRYLNEHPLQYMGEFEDILGSTEAYNKFNKSIGNKITKKDKEGSVTFEQFVQEMTAQGIHAFDSTKPLKDLFLEFKDVMENSEVPSTFDYVNQCIADGTIKMDALIKKTKEFLDEIRQSSEIVQSLEKAGKESRTGGTTGATSGSSTGSSAKPNTSGSQEQKPAGESSQQPSGAEGSKKDDTSEINRELSFIQEALDGARQIIEAPLEVTLEILTDYLNSISSCYNKLAELQKKVVTLTDSSQKNILQQTINDLMNITIPGLMQKASTGIVKIGKQSENRNTASTIITSKYADITQGDPDKEQFILKLYGEIINGITDGEDTLNDALAKVESTFINAEPVSAIEKKVAELQSLIQVFNDSANDNSWYADYLSGDGSEESNFSFIEKYIELLKSFSQDERIASGDARYFLDLEETAKQAETLSHEIIDAWDTTEDAVLSQKDVQLGEILKKLFADSAALVDVYAQRMNSSLIPAIKEFFGLISETGTYKDMMSGRKFDMSSFVDPILNKTSTPQEVAAHFAGESTSPQPVVINPVDVPVTPVLAQDKYKDVLDKLNKLGEKITPSVEVTGVTIANNQDAPVIDAEIRVTEQAITKENTRLRTDKKFITIPAKVDEDDLGHIQTEVDGIQAKKIDVELNSDTFDTNVSNVINRLGDIPDTKEIKLSVIDYDQLPLLTDSLGKVVEVYRGLKDRFGINGKNGIEWYTDDLELAKDYADSLSSDGKIIKSNLVFKKPLEIDAKGSKFDKVPFDARKMGWDTDRTEWVTDDLVEEAKKYGFDGVIFRNIKDGFDDVARNVFTIIDGIQRKGEEVLGGIKQNTGADNFIPIDQMVNQEKFKAAITQMNDFIIAATDFREQFEKIRDSVINGSIQDKDLMLGWIDKYITGFEQFRALAANTPGGEKTVGEIDANLEQFRGMRTAVADSRQEEVTKKENFLTKLNTDLDALDRKIEELKTKLSGLTDFTPREGRKTLADVINDDHTSLDEAIGTEEKTIGRLRLAMEGVLGKVREKNQAFKDEATIVKDVVKEEVGELAKLQKELKETAKSTETVSKSNLKERYRNVIMTYKKYGDINDFKRTLQDQFTTDELNRIAGFDDLTPINGKGEKTKFNRMNKATKIDTLADRATQLYAPPQTLVQAINADYTHFNTIIASIRDSISTINSDLSDITSVNLTGFTQEITTIQGILNSFMSTPVSPDNILAQIREIVNQGEALSNFARILSSTEERIRAASEAARQQRERDNALQRANNNAAGGGGGGNGAGGGGGRDFDDIIDDIDAGARGGGGGGGDITRNVPMVEWVVAAEDYAEVLGEILRVTETLRTETDETGEVITEAMGYTLYGRHGTGRLAPMRDEEGNVLHDDAGNRIWELGDVQTTVLDRRFEQQQLGTRLANLSELTDKVREAGQLTGILAEDFDAAWEELNNATEHSGLGLFDEMFKDLKNSCAQLLSDSKELSKISFNNAINAMRELTAARTAFNLARAKRIENENEGTIREQDLAAERVATARRNARTAENALRTMRDSTGHNRLSPTQRSQFETMVTSPEYLSGSAASLKKLREAEDKAARDQEKRNQDQYDSNIRAVQNYIDVITELNNLRAKEVNGDEVANREAEAYDNLKTAAKGAYEALLSMWELESQGFINADQVAEFESRYEKLNIDDDGNVRLVNEKLESSMFDLADAESKDKLEKALQSRIDKVKQAIGAYDEARMKVDKLQEALSNGESVAGRLTSAMSNMDKRQKNVQELIKGMDELSKKYDLGSDYMNAVSNFNAQSSEAFTYEVNGDKGFENAKRGYETLSKYAQRYYDILAKIAQKGEGGISASENLFKRTYEGRFEQASLRSEEFESGLGQGNATDEEIKKTASEYKENIANAMRDDLASLSDEVIAALNKMGAKGNRPKSFDEKFNKLSERFNAFNQDILNTNWVEQVTGGEESFNDARARFQQLAKEANNLMNEIINLDKSSSSKQVNEVQKAALGRKMAEWKDHNTAAKEAGAAIEELQKQLVNIDDQGQLNNLSKRFEEVKQRAFDTGEAGESFIDKLRGSLSNLSRYLLSFGSFYEIIGAIRQGVNVVIELDTQLTEMRKVSDETTASLKKYQIQTFNVAETVGTTAAQIQSSTADFMRLGKSMEEAAKMAELANKLMNVSEFNNINEATDSLISITQAYKDIDPNDIVDKLNMVGNNFAISTDEISRGLQDAAAVLVTQGNTLDQSLALLTSGNLINQDISKTAAGLRTISLRIAGTEEAKEQLQELGEEVDDFVVQTRSKTDQIIRDYTAVASNNYQGVSVLDDNGNLRSTYQILLDISKIYKEIQEEDKKSGNNASVALVEQLANPHCQYI